MIDPLDIQKKYKAMSDAELVHFTSQEAGNLTETAFQILKGEFSQRNLNPDILHQIEDGSYFVEQARLKKIFKMVPDQSGATALSIALNEKRDGKNDESITYLLMDGGMEEDKARIIIGQIRPQAVERINKSKSTMLTSLFISCAGIALKLIIPEKTYVTFLDIVAPCTMIFGLLRLLKGYFDFNKYNAIVRNVDNEQDNIQALH